MDTQREIKFRVWDKENKVWIDSFHIRKNGDVMFDLGGYGEDVSVLQNIVLVQYTGLNDKNGKEIYEGDYLKDSEGFYFEVVFGKLPLDKSGDCVCTFQSYYAKGLGKWGQPAHYEAEEIADWMEVVGNIYENPELLK